MPNARGSAAPVTTQDARSATAVTMACNAMASVRSPLSFMVSYRSLQSRGGPSPAEPLAPLTAVDDGWWRGEAAGLPQGRV